MPIPSLDETFAGCVGRWRVVDKRGEEGRGPRERFAVMMLPMGAPLDGMKRTRRREDIEVELCAVQYRPHAEAIAALPEMVEVLSYAASHDGNPEIERGSVADYLIERSLAAKAKAEGRAS